MSHRVSMPPLDERFADLERPAPGALWEVPFVVVCFLPTRDDISIDPDLTGHTGSIRQLHDRIVRLARLTKWMMEEGSRFHGYRDPSALPSLGYRCIRFVTYFEDIPRGRSAGPGGVCFPDYKAIVERAGGERLVNQEGAKEFWVYHWHYGRVAPIETNMASRLTGNISNSDRLPDLPLYNTTYLVLGVNFDRGPDKHVHNMGHQMEAALRYAAVKQDGNPQLFDRDFCGLNARGQLERGRCGTCHTPPNGTKDYDYSNPTPVLSDIEDWNPLGTGTKKPISCATWESLPYQSPTGDRIRQAGTIFEDDAYWYLYWFQNFPGRENGIPHPNGEMTNWWRFLGDWDGANRERYGLWKPKAPAVIPPPLRSGEMRLDGVVRSVRPGTIVLLAESVTLPGREAVTLSPGREKTILFDDALKFRRGDRIAAIGVNRGDGKPLQARWTGVIP